MTLEELLKAQGIEDAKISAVLTSMKENKIFTASEENLDVRYGKLKAEHDGKLGELGEASKLIDELKKSSKGNEEFQGKITEYESQVQALQAELETTKLESAVKVALLSEKAQDVDYLTFKLKEKGDAIQLDENGSIKGWDDLISGLKTQFPTQFESSQSKKFEENKLPNTEEKGNAITKDSFQKMGYMERVKLANENPEAYKALTEN